MNVRTYVPLAFSLILTLILGFLLGRLTALESKFAQSTPMKLTQDERPTIPVVTFEGSTDGTLKGDVDGNVRLFAGDEMILPDKDGHFDVPTTMFRATVIVKVPDGMTFVASKNGKKYYGVHTPSGERIAPQNRVYFTNEEAARAAGYEP